jgi:hypothetical protein
MTLGAPIFIFAMFGVVLLIAASIAYSMRMQRRAVRVSAEFHVEAR